MSYKMTTRRKLAISTWSAPKDGTIYGKLTIDVAAALQYIDYLREKYGRKVTITHLVGKAVGVALAKAPDVNGRIILGRYKPHKSVDLSFLVSLKNGADLAKIKICDVDRKTTAEIAEDVSQKANTLVSGKDSEFEKSQSLLRILPTFLVRPLVWFLGFLTSGLGVNMRMLGLSAFPFGSCIITSVGMFGVDEGYAPPTPFARVPIYIAITKIKDRPVVRQNKIVIKKQLDLFATIDHRFVDGQRLSQIAHDIRNGLEKPWELDGMRLKPMQEEYSALTPV